MIDFTWRSKSLEWTRSKPLAKRRTTRMLYDEYFRLESVVVAGEPSGQCLYEALTLIGPKELEIGDAKGRSAGDSGFEPGILNASL
ncbi:hypothetical protein [Variovorax sp. YR216]|uniref:hypothetical protein n=1 Tax=Variovorax sp. YR216 TaxID=1882828 RepID=UPI00115FD4FA|nr:hypothetical protein [Variovorax sp. YR216]